MPHKHTHAITHSITLPHAAFLSLSFSLSLSLCLFQLLSPVKSVTLVVCLSVRRVDGWGHWGEGGGRGSCQLLWRKPMGDLVVESTFPNSIPPCSRLDSPSRPLACLPARLLRSCIGVPVCYTVLVPLPCRTRTLPVSHRKKRDAKDAARARSRFSEPRPETSSPPQ
ncbi:hypothetical protein LZ31DRAFT_237057 [Colletotrichum somersetense]|nr:hypothetical protein LZ31DRAFT_237057 [Colletotrichum somersetense]